MISKDLKKIWNAAKKDAKKHPNKYKPKYPSLWQIGEAKRFFVGSNPTACCGNSFIT